MPPAKTISILQPTYMSWLGCFEQIHTSDVFVSLDHVQYITGWINRNRILTPNGSMWLTVPIVRDKSPTRSRICDVDISYDHNWVDHHLKSIKQFYSRAEFFDAYYPSICDILNNKYKKLIDLDVALRGQIVNWLGIKTSIKSSFGYSITSTKGDMILDICKLEHATDYYTGDMAKDYLNIEEFNQNGICVHFQNYVHPEYKQLFGDKFVSHLSILDLLLNYGEDSLGILLGVK